MSSIHSIKSNARRAARKAGIDPELVYAVPEGWKCPEAPSTDAPSTNAASVPAINPLSIAPADLAAAETLTTEQRAEVFEGAAIAHKVASEFIADVAKANPKTCPKCSAVFGSCNHTDGTAPAAPVNTAAALVADLDAKAAKRVKAKPITIKATKTVKTVKAKPAKVAAKPRGKRDGVCNKVIKAIHARWTSVDELLKLSGWKRHTLRGYISTRAAKDGFTVEKRKVDGVPQYRVAA